MTNEKLIAYILDWLAGELSAEEEQELATLLKAQPEMERHARELKALWDELEHALPVATDTTPVLERVYHRITLGHNQDTLSDEDLDQAAGGTFRPHAPHPFTHDPDE